MSKYFDDIINSELTVSEKENMIEERLEEMKKDANEAYEQILKGMEYCKECGEYYKASAWEAEIKKEMRNVCTFWPLAEFDDPTYEDKLCEIEYKTCPCGHIHSRNLSYPGWNR